jgi:hypothetical protein
MAPTEHASRWRRLSALTDCATMRASMRGRAPRQPIAASRRVAMSPIILHMGSRFLYDESS